MRQHIVSTCLVVCIGICSVSYGFLTSENAVTMGVRGDVSPLYVPLGPRWGTMLPKLVLTQLMCIAPGELVLAVVMVLASGRLERTVGSLRFAAMLLVLLTARCATVCAWCVLVSGASILEVRICPSVLWLCTSLYILRVCLFRSRGQILLGQTVPVNQHLLQHALMLQLAWTHRSRFWDTTLPAGVVAAILCSEFVAVHQWATTDVGFIGRWLHRMMLGRRLRPELRKTFRRLTPTIRSTSTAAGGLAAAAGGGPRVSAQPPAAEGTTLSNHHHNGVSLLVDMGFTEEASREALLRTGGDTNGAATLLLQGGMHQ